MNGRKKRDVAFKDEKEIKDNFNREDFEKVEEEIIYQCFYFLWKMNWTQHFFIFSSIVEIYFKKPDVQFISG